MNNLHTNPHSCKRMYREEDWIDWLLNAHNTEQHEAMRLHLTMCMKCRETVEHWAPLLQIHPAETAVLQEHVMPSNEVYQRLRRQVKVRGLRQRLQHHVRTKGKWAAGAAAGVFLLACVWSITQYKSQQPENQRSEYVAHHEPNAVMFMGDPATASYQVHPFNDQLGEGYLWYNESSLELLVLLEGLLSSEGRDVQAWAVDERGHASLGLLQRDEADRAHLYLKGESLGNGRNIVLTVEPAGGSEHPTTPDAFVFRIQKR